MYDARKRSGSINSNATFAGIAIIVVVVAFLVALKLPVRGSSELTTDSVAALNPAASVDALEDIFRDKTSRTYLALLREVDSGSYADLETAVLAAGGSKDQKMQALIGQTGDILAMNADALAHSDVRYFDEMLMIARDGLRQAARSKSRFCQGSRYSRLNNMSEADTRRFGEQLMELEGPLREISLKMNTVLLKAIRDARAHPVSYGPLNAADKAAMQGLVMSMVSDPQIMPLMMQARSGTQPEDLLAKLNVCELGVTAVMAVRTLPQDTKGRVWAEAIRQGMTGGGDLSQFKGIGGF